MPRTVNFSDRDKGRQNDSPVASRFFGLGRRTSPSPVEQLDAAPAMMAPPVEASAPEEPKQELETAAEPFFVAEQTLAPSVVAAVVNEEGNVDFEQLFEAAHVPAVSVTAEKATHILESIPREIPFNVKRVLVKTSLNLMSDLAQDEALSSGIVTDAAQKMLWIARLQENLTAEIQEKRETVGADIARLEAEIAVRRAELEGAEARATTALRACSQRTIKLHDVTLFFDDQSGPSGNGTPGSSIPSLSDEDETEPEELPPYMREDSVLRLLGIPASMGGAVEHPERTLAISTGTGQVRNSARRYSDRPLSAAKLDPRAST